MNNQDRQAAWDRVADEMRAAARGNEFILANTTITVIIILVLAGVGLWLGA